MSYCVNCGVELRESEKRCPLCDTVVINPNIAFDETAEPAFPKEQLIADLAENRKLTVLLITVILSIPTAVCIVCNLAIDRSISWSILVAGAMVMLWSFIVPPLVIKSIRFLAVVVIDTMSLLAYLYLISHMIQLEKDWYYPLAFPLVLCVVAFVCINVGIIKSSKLSKLYMAALIFVTIGALLVAIEVITDIYLRDTVDLFWSLITLIPCALLALLYVIIERKNRVKQALQKKLNF